jgi:hypothetical protein
MIQLIHTKRPEPMSTYNPYIATLIEMGYDEGDCRMAVAAGQDATYPRTIHGRTFETKAEYDEALADFLNGM